MDKTGQDWNGMHLCKFEKRWPTIFKFTVCQFIHVSKCHLLSWKIILICYLAMVLQTKDSWSANLTFRAHYKQLPKIAWPSPFDFIFIDLDTFYVGVLPNFIWEYFGGENKQIRRERAALVDSFRRFQPALCKAIVDYHALYVRVESINPTFNIASKIEAV